MKCQILFSGKNKKNISKCRLLKILLRVLSVNIFQKVVFRLALYTEEVNLQNFCHDLMQNHLS